MLLDLGMYKLQVEASGFKTFVRDNIQLTTGETTTVDVRLELGRLERTGHGDGGEPAATH